MSVHTTQVRKQDHRRQGRRSAGIQSVYPGKLPNNPSIKLMHESAYRLTSKKAKTLITD